MRLNAKHIYEQRESNLTLWNKAKQSPSASLSILFSFLVIYIRPILIFNHRWHHGGQERKHQDNKI